MAPAGEGGTIGDKSDPALHPDGRVSAASAEGEREGGTVDAEGDGGEGARILVLRGVAWRADTVEPLRLWQGLARFWPSSLSTSGPAASIFAHSGMTRTATAAAMCVCN